MSDFEAYKSGVIDCLTLLANKGVTSTSINNMISGIHSLEKPEAFMGECNWLETIIEKYAETGIVNISEQYLPDTINLVLDGFTALTDPEEIIEFINSIHHYYDDGSMDDYDFFEYCLSIIKQLEYIGNKRITPQIVCHTHTVLNGSSIYYFDDNRYKSEFEWIKNICSQLIDDGKVKIIEKSIPSGISFCKFIGELIVNKEQMIDFIKSIRLTDSEESVENVQNLSDEIEYEL